MSIIVNQVEVDLTAADQTFINLIQNRLTAYGQIPYTVPVPLIIDMIKESAIYFFTHYYKASSRVFYRLPLSSISEFVANHDSSVEGRVGYVVQLPEYIQVVKEIYKVGPGSSLTFERADYTRGQNNYQGLDTSLYLLESVALQLEQNAIRSIFKTTVSHNFNPLTKILDIAEKLTDNVILETISNINLQLLYNDDYFRRYTIGKTKRELKRIVGNKTIPLPGNATLNIEELCNNLEDIEKVEDILRAGNGVGDIILIG